MKTIQMSLNEISYSVYIGEGVISFLKDYVTPLDEVLIITDERVAALHLKTLLPFVNEPLIFTLSPAPEGDKTLSTYQRLLEVAVKHTLSRHVKVIGFGGGAVGDFAAFFASTYKRGVSFIAIPTTLLAHDSAIGGKTGLNVGEVKNVIGTFYQPKVVLYDTRFLATLPDEELLSGLGELIKHDLLNKGEWITHWMNHPFSLKQLDWEPLLFEGMSIKKKFVEQDVFEQNGMRQFLNFGHTFGHAIERVNLLSHGEAILLGICFEMYLSKFPWKSYYEGFRKMGYFTHPIKEDVDLYIEIMKNDKKNRPHKLSFIGIKAFGEVYDMTLDIPEVALKVKQFILEIKAW